MLEVLRRRIASAIDDPNIRGADLAALSRRLMDISDEIEQLDPPQDGPSPSRRPFVSDRVFDPESV